MLSRFPCFPRAKCGTHRCAMGECTRKHHVWSSLSLLFPSLLLLRLRKINILLLDFHFDMSSRIYEPGSPAVQDARQIRQRRHCVGTVRSSTATPRRRSCHRVCVLDEMFDRHLFHSSLSLCSVVPPSTRLSACPSTPSRRSSIHNHNYNHNSHNHSPRRPSRSTTFAPRCLPSAQFCCHCSATIRSSPLSPTTTRLVCSHSGEKQKQNAKPLSLRAAVGRLQSQSLQCSLSCFLRALLLCSTKRTAIRLPYIVSIPVG